MRRTFMNMTLKKILSPIAVFLLLAANVFLPFSSCQAQPNGEWAEALKPRKWNFPRDHGAHPEHQTEWWYFTGNLTGESGAHFGYQLTFFRFGVRRNDKWNNNPWYLRDLFMAHFAITEQLDDGFRFPERISREGPGLAGARQDRMGVWVLNWSAQMKESFIVLKAEDGPLQINLTLRPLKPLVFHGNAGLSKKGDGKGQASFYTSFTELQTEGFIRNSENGPSITVRGKSWFDHEFGSNQLARKQEDTQWRLGKGSMLPMIPTF